MGLRERKAVNYATENIGSNTPAWMKGSKGRGSRLTDSEDEHTEEELSFSARLSKGRAVPEKDASAGKGKRMNKENVQQTAHAYTQESMDKHGHDSREAARGKDRQKDKAGFQQEKAQKKQKKSKSAPLPEPEPEIVAAANKPGTQGDKPGLKAGAKRRNDEAENGASEPDLERHNYKRKKNSKSAPMPAPELSDDECVTTKAKGGRQATTKSEKTKPGKSVKQVSPGTSDGGMEGMAPSAGKVASSGKAPSINAAIAKVAALASASLHQPETVGGSHGFKSLEDLAREQQAAKHKPSSGRGKSAGSLEVEAAASEPAPAPPRAHTSEKTTAPLHAPVPPSAPASVSEQRPPSTAAAASAQPSLQEGAHKTDLIEPAAPDITQDAQAFKALQEQYTRLQELYQQLKEQKITQLEGLLEEQEEYVEAMNESMSKLAQHWKEEAERQMALATKAGATETLARLAQLEEENVKLQHARIEQEIRAVEHAKRAAGLQAQLEAARATAEQAASLALQLEEAHALAEAAMAEADEVKEALAKTQELAAAANVQLPVSPAPGSVFTGTPGSVLLAAARRRSFAMQCPTPPEPSPGVGCQFPTPAPPAAAATAKTGAAQGISALAARLGAAARSLLPYSPATTSVLGCMPTTSGPNDRHANTEAGPFPASASGPSPMHASGVAAAVQAMPDDVAGSASVAARRRSIGSPVDGLCTVQGPDAAPVPDGSSDIEMEALPRALVPEGFEVAVSRHVGAGALGFGCAASRMQTAMASARQSLPRAYPQQQQQDKQGSNEDMVVDLDPRSAQKAAATRGRVPVMRMATLPDMDNTGSTPSLVLDGNKSEQLAAEALAAAPSPRQVLTAGMQQFVVAANATAAKLQTQAESLDSNGAAGMSQPQAQAGAGTAHLHRQQQSPLLSMQGSTSMMPGAAGKTPGRTFVQMSPGAAGAPPSSMKALSMTPKMARMQCGVLSLFGFEVLPLPREGAFEYRHAATGLCFQTRPAEVEDSEMNELVGTGTTLLSYNPVAIGTAKLPPHLREPILFEVSQKQAFMNQLWAAITKPNGL